MSHYEMLHGDCLEKLKELPDCSVDAVVTDPPYGIGFMGKEWDAFGSFFERKANKAVRFDHVGGNHNPSNSADAARTKAIENKRFQEWCEKWAVECLRVLKPGGHLLAFGGDRTHHRLTCAIEDAGFEIRTAIVWHFGSGFPKNLNVTKALEKEIPAHAQCVCVRHLKQTPQDSRAYCPADSRFDDAQPRLEATAYQASLRPQDDVLAHSHFDPPRDDRDEEQASSGLDAKTDHPSTDYSPHRSAEPASLPIGDNALFGKSLNTSNGQSKVVRKTADDTRSKSHSGGGLVSSLASNPPLSNANLPRCAECGNIKIPQGLGTALKPASEFITVARRPLTGTVAENVLEHGTGALNIDGCRVGTNAGWSYPNGWGGSGWHGRESLSRNLDEPLSASAGRWPPNVIFSHLPECHQVGTKRVKTGVAVRHNGVRGGTIGPPGAKAAGTPDMSYAGPDGLETVEAWECAEGCAVRELDEQSGVLQSPKNYTRTVTAQGEWLHIKPAGSEQLGYGDTGGASRFFPAFRYQAKPSRREREAGLEELTKRNNMRVNAPRESEEKKTASRSANFHPTVKPVELMRWCVRLVTPKDGTVLDPFTGSGTTGVAAILEGFRFIGCEREDDYFAIAKARIDNAVASLGSKQEKQPMLFDLEGM